MRLGGAFWACAAPGALSAEGGAETPEGGVELIPPRPGLVDAQVEVPAPPCEAGGDVEELVAQRRRLGEPRL